MPMPEPARFRLPDDRPSITHKRTICGVETYTTVSFYDDPPDRARPAEVFCILGRHGDVLSGLVDGWCILLSMLLQYGVPFEVIEQKFLGTRFGQQDVVDGVENTSLLDGLAKAIRHCIEGRAAIVGDDDLSPSAQLPPPDEPPSALEGVTVPKPKAPPSLSAAVLLPDKERETKEVGHVA